MKQVLSVADFVTILNLVDKEIESVSWGIQNAMAEGCSKSAIQQIKIEKKYDNLIHLKKSLQNLNIEVECPDVEIKGE